MSSHTPAEISASLAPAARWAAFIVLLAGGILPPIDFFIVNVALPSIRSTLGASPAEVQLVISAYAACYAVFLVTGGRLGDLYGRRRLFLLGMAGFTLTSVLCGVAPSPLVLVIGRALEGLAAAVLAPQVLASIRALYTGHALNRAFSLYGAMMGLAAAVGQLLGGVLVALDIWGLGWRIVFLVNLPIGLAATLAALALVPETSAPSRPQLDFGGAGLLSAALLCLVVPLSVGPDNGWPGWSLAMLVAAPPLCLLFLWFEDRVAAHGGMPLLDLGLLRVGSFRRGVLIATLFFFTSAFYLLFSLYQQGGRGTDALHTGLAILPYGIGLFLGPLVTAPLLRRFRTRLFAAGMVIEVAGYAAVAAWVVVPDPGAVMTLLLFAAGCGQGIAMPRLINLVLADVSPHQAGLAAGILNSVLQIGAALSAAGVGSLFFATLGSEWGFGPYAHAMQVAMMAIVAALVVALAIALLPARRRAVR